MSDTKYNFDDYIFDNVLEDTYLAIKDVREMTTMFFIMTSSLKSYMSVIRHAKIFVAH